MNHSKLKIVALIAAGMLFAGSAAFTQPYLYTSGHADLGLGEGQELEPHIHAEDVTIVNGVLAEDLGIEEFEADEIIIAVPDSTFTLFTNLGGRPASSPWELTGVGAGEGLWFLPQLNSDAQTANAPWLGIGAEEVELNYWDNNSISLVLKDVVSAPTDGVFSLWQAGLSTTFFMSTFDLIDSSDIFTLSDISLADHDHASWGFSKAGIYEITFAAQAEKNGQLFEEEATFTFAVGDAAIASVPEPSTVMMLTVGALLVGWFAWRRRRG